MRKLIAACILLWALHLSASTTTLTGVIRDEQGNPLNGTLVMRLPIPAQDPNTNTAIAPTPVNFQLVNGNVVGGAPLYDLATIQPLHLWYSARGYDTAGRLAFYGNYFVTGATFNIGAATPTVVTTSNISFFNPTQITSGVVNATAYPGADMCARINAAMLANPSLPIDARGFTGNQPCGSNPFTGQAADLELFLGAVNVQTTVPWVTSSLHQTRVLGTTRNNLTSPPATKITASGGFPATCDGLGTGCPIYREGDFSGGTNGSFGQMIENITLDCNGLTGGIGLYSNDIQEQSGARFFQVLNCPVYGVFMDGSFGAGKGAENYTLEHGEVYPFGATTASTVGVKIIGSNSTVTNARVMSDITVGSSTITHGLAGFQITGSGNGVMMGLNSEQWTTEYDLGLGGGTSAVNGLAMIGITCGPGATKCVWIHAGSQNIDISTLVNGNTLVPSIQDDTALPSGNTVNDLLIAHYLTANNGATRLNTSSSPQNSGNGNLFPWMNVQDTAGNTGFFAATENADHPVQLNFNSGLTAAQGQAINLSDRGTLKWVMQNTGTNGINTNAFQVFDQNSNIPRLFFSNTVSNTGYTSLQSAGTAAVLINSGTNSGTGGFQSCAGGGGTPTCSFTVTAAGAMTSSGETFSSAPAAESLVCTVATTHVVGHCTTVPSGTPPTCGCTAP